MRKIKTSPLLYLFVLALVLRMTAFVQSLDNPLFHTLVLDEAYYHSLARSVADGYWLGQDTPFFMDPLYGYFIGFVYFFAGENTAFVKIIQVALDSLNAILVCVIATRVWDRRVGLTAGGLYAVYKVSFFYALLLLKTTLSITFSLVFILSMIWASERKGRVQWFVIGLLSALLVYLRANLLLLPLLGLRVYLVLRKPGIKEFSMACLLFLLGLTLLLFPGAWRNYHVGGEWVWFNTQGGRLLYSSNNPENLSGLFQMPGFSRPGPNESERDFHIEAERRVGKKMTPQEVSFYWTLKTVRFWANNILLIPKLAYNKLTWTIGNHEIPNNHSFYLYEKFAPILALPLPSFAFVLALGVPGLIMGLRRNKKTLWVFVPVSAMLITVLLFYSSSRFRMPAVPFLIMGAAFFITTLYDRLKKTAYGHALPILMHALAFGTVSLIISAPPSTGNEESQLARAYWQVGDYGNASRVAEEGFKKYPRQERLPLVTGMSKYSRGEVEEALEWYERAYLLNPKNPDVCHDMGLALLASGKANDSLKWFKKGFSLNGNPNTLFSLARAYEILGDNAKAKAAFEEILKIAKPHSPLWQRAKERSE